MSLLADNMFSSVASGRSTVKTKVFRLLELLAPHSRISPSLPLHARRKAAQCVELGVQVDLHHTMLGCGENGCWEAVVSEAPPQPERDTSSRIERCLCEDMPSARQREGSLPLPLHLPIPKPFQTLINPYKPPLNLLTLKPETLHPKLLNPKPQNPKP